MARHAPQVAIALVLAALAGFSVEFRPEFRLKAEATGAKREADAAQDEKCEQLRSLALPNVTMTATQAVSAANEPGFCRVTAALKPSSDSDIAIEVRLPIQNWNGKFQAVGNGAWSGSIPSGAMTEALRRGYATAGTDTGHTGNNAAFALGHPEKLIDFAYRSEHEMTVAAKAIVAAYYGRAPRFSYWNGCSAGGRQAMKEAQMFPSDFDGIVAGSPGLDWSARSAQAVRTAHALQKEESRLTPETLRIVHDAVVNACDAKDGVKDGLIADPSRCAFDPSTLSLPAAQIASVRAVYASAVNPANSREMPGLAPGSERGWTELGWTASARATGLDHFRFIVFKDPQWTIDRFNPAADTFRLDDGDAAIANASDTNLDPFFQRNGKLIQYHGWSDPQISPFSSAAYYRQVVQRFGAARVNALYRLFMAPGMGHCSGGEGPSQFDALGALERWVEQGKAPDEIVASHATGGRVDRTRPLCPYPQIAAYDGSGSIDAAASFTCKTR